MIDLLNIFKFRYLILFAVLLMSGLIATNYYYGSQKNTYVSEMLIKPVPLYDNVFSNYRLFRDTEFNRLQLTPLELIGLVTNELKNSEFSEKIASEIGIKNDLIGIPNITYPRTNPSQGIPEGSIMLNVNASSDKLIPDYLIRMVEEAASDTREKVLQKFSIFLEENENLKNDELQKIRLSIKKIITLFDNEIKDIQNEIVLSKDLGFVEPVISGNFTPSENSYLAGTVVLERRVRDLQGAKQNVLNLLKELDNTPVEQAVYQIVHEFLRYAGEHEVFARVGGSTGLTEDLISFKVYEYIENSISIEQAIDILKRSEFQVVSFNETSIKIENLKKSSRSYFIFSSLISIFLTFLVIVILETYTQRKL